MLYPTGEMESLSELDLCEHKVGDVDSLYTDIDIIDEMGKTSRPSSTASFASWTFSPIQEEVSDIQEPDSLMKAADSSASNQNQFPVLNQSISNKNCNQTNVNVLHQQHNDNQSSEYNFPNGINYHQSVNIHNYVGNYCVPHQPVWKEACMWEGLGQQSFPPVSHMHNDRNMAAMPKPSCQSDSLALLPNPSMEFTSCSTPEYLMALNSLHQLDSPPRPNHSAAMNFSCSSFNDSVNHNSSVKQDSGYNSDLNCSPVIQYQDNNAKLPSNLPSKRQTSTPNPYQQYLTIAPLQLFHNDNMLSNQNPNMPHSIAMVPRFLQNYCAAKQPNMLPQNAGVMNMNTLQHNIMNQRVSAIKAESQPNLKFTSVAEIHNAKKMEYQMKKKSLQPKPVSRPKSTAADSSDSAVRRRRHNEPLSEQALQVMSDWYQTNSEHPYPSKAEKEQLAKDGGITISQVKSWFANKRNRSNNTRPKKQKIAMEARLLDLCHQLARDARKPDKDNAYYIQQLSSIMSAEKAEHEHL